MARGEFGEALREVDRLFGAGTMAGLGEAQLLERFAGDRDEAAFAVLVARHGPMVLGVCRRLLRHEQDVEDAFQATFLVLARRAGGLRDAGKLAPWLYGVAHKVAARSRAVAGRRRDRERSVPDVAEPADHRRAARDPDLDECRAVLHEEVNRLPAKYRSPVVLCHLEGQTHEQAAALLSWPVGTVRGRLSRARGLLKSRLARRGLAGLVAPVLARLDRGAAEAAEVVPRGWIDQTARLAARAAGGRAATALAVPAAVAALTEGALTTMTFAPWKIAATGLVAVGLVAPAVALQQPGDIRPKVAADPFAATSPFDPADAAKGPTGAGPARR